MLGKPRFLARHFFTIGVKARWHVLAVNGAKT
jgi:hypothetical protein